MHAVRLSEGRGQNNQQPTPNDNNKRVVVFLCGSGIWSPQRDVLQAFRQGAGGKGRASNGEYMWLGMVLTPLQPTTVVRKSPGVEQWWWIDNRGVTAVMEQRGSKGTVPASRMRWTVMGWSGLMRNNNNGALGQHWVTYKSKDREGADKQRGRVNVVALLRRKQTLPCSLWLLVLIQEGLWPCKHKWLSAW